MKHVGCAHCAVGCAHMCNNHKTYHDQAKQEMSKPTLDLWMLEYEYWEWWLVPHFAQVEKE